MARNLRAGVKVSNFCRAGAVQYRGQSRPIKVIMSQGGGGGGGRGGGGGGGRGREGEEGGGGRGSRWPSITSKNGSQSPPHHQNFFITNNAGELQISGVALHILPMRCYLRKILQHRYAISNARLVLSEIAL